MRLIAPLLLLLLLMFAGAASATDYYVSTTGDNTTSGNITHPWQNVSYATQQAAAGDTIHMFDGTWYDEHVVFANSGNATHPITLTSYNGTPTLDGVDRTGYGIRGISKDHIRIIGPMWIGFYESSTAFTTSDYITISNIEADGGWYNVSGSGTSLITFGYCNHTITENSVFHDSGWNTVGFAGYREPPNGDGTPLINATVKNCTIYNSTNHNAIDFYGNVENITIEDNIIHNCTTGGVFTHDSPDHQKYATIYNNTFRDMGISASIEAGQCSYWDILNNTVINGGTNYPLYVYLDAHHIDIRYNEFYNTQAVRTSGVWNNILFDRNYLHSDCGTYMISSNSTATIRNPLGKKDVDVRFNNSNTSLGHLEWDDRTVFTATPSGDYISWTPVRYYSDRSNCSLTSGTSNALIGSVTTYNITLRPTNAYLKDVTINHESDAADDRTNISINSSVSSSPTWINATMQNFSNTYNVSIDGVYSVQKTSDSMGIVRYQYTSSWSPHVFEFDWHSTSGFSGAPDPINLANTTAQTWVNHTWAAGSGNVTDSYNVSVNSVWHSTPNKYYNNTGMSAGTWCNISVWAWNNTGGISQNSISQNTKSDGTAFSPDHSKSYHNATSAILCTVNGTGYYVWNRTIAEYDVVVSGSTGATI